MILNERELYSILTNQITHTEFTYTEIKPRYYQAYLYVCMYRICVQNTNFIDIQIQFPPLGDSFPLYLNINVVSKCKALCHSITHLYNWVAVISVSSEHSAVQLHGT